MADATSDRIIVALDVPDVSSALLVIEQTHEYVGWYKVGLELIASQEAARVIGWIKRFGGKVFYDIKLNDIPTTVERAVRASRGLSVDLINIHATAGVEAMRKAKEAAGEATTVAAVTVLTSMDANDLLDLGFHMPEECTDADRVGAQVCKLAQRVYEAGLTHLICSPKDLDYLKREHLVGEPWGKFKTVTPGIRPAWAAANDQKRVMTPAEAMAAGANMIVVGRPITNPPDGYTRESAAKAVYDEVYSFPSSGS